MKEQETLHFIKALETGDRDLMHRVPRTDVHNHVALGGDFQSWTKRTGLDLKESEHNFPDFTIFQDYVDNILSYPYKNPTKKQAWDRLFGLFAATYELAIADGISYIEPVYDSTFLEFFDMDLELMIKIIGDQIDYYKPRITIMPDIGIMRTNEIKDVERTIYPCIESGFFKALDLYADERVGPPENFQHIYKAAKKSGMKLKAHAGELLDADFVQRSVEILDLDEVQHGISAANSKKVMTFLEERQTRLNICPSSNIQLCQVDSFRTHPLRILLDNGINTSVNTDDAIIFGRKSSDEFFSLYETGLYNAEELNQVRLNGFPDKI